jgi:predicted metal-dependent hydrolase
MVTPTKIIRTNRRSLSLTIAKDGSLIVRAPKRLSMDYIYSFIKQKEKWILNKQRSIQNSRLTNNAFFSGEQYMFCGDVYTAIAIDKLKQIEISNGNIYVPIDNFDGKRNLMLYKFYTSVTKEIISKRLEYFANIMQVNYSSIKIVNSKAKWGSCSSAGDLQFNLRLSMLPHKVIDYVIIHELSHLIEFNHSKQFYSIIESVMPDYKKHRTRLKELNFLLQLLR